MTESNIKDLTIIGGGPAGLYAAFYAGMRDLTVRIVENKSSLGGKLHFYPEKTIWDIGGHAPITGMRAVEQMVAQAETFDPEIRLNQKITEIKKLDDQLFLAKSITGEEFYSRSLIIATGGGIFNPKRLPFVDYRVDTLSHKPILVRNFQVLIKECTARRNNSINFTPGFQIWFTDG